MPKATVSTDVQTFNLKSCPGGYIKAKPLSYGQKKSRADKSGQMFAELKERGGLGNKMFLETITTQSTLFDYQHCIVDHNLEDDNGNKLNFNNDATLDVLDPIIGTEIEDILAKLNGDDVDMRDFTSQLNGSSEEMPTAKKE
jgi:hypothetical protein